MYTEEEKEAIWGAFVEEFWSHFGLTADEDFDEARDYQKSLRGWATGLVDGLKKRLLCAFNIVFTTSSN